jgi:hypothetical protein
MAKETHSDTSGSEGAAEPSSLPPSRTISDATRQRLVEALLAANVGRPRRGPPRREWRTKLAVPLAAIMKDFPKERLADLAEILRAAEEEAARSGKKNLHLPSARTIANWLSKVRSGQHVHGRKPKGSSP